MRAVSVLFVLAISSIGAAPASALEVRVAEIRTIGPTIRASLDLSDVFSDKFAEIIKSGQPLHVRVQTEMWEDRPLWDKLVRPAIVSVFRIMRDPNAQITVEDAIGTVASLADLRAPLPLRVDAAPADSATDSAKYYLRIIATVGTIEAREAQETGDAVFGRDDSAISVAGVGKLIFRTVVHISDYLQSISAETRSRTFGGKELKQGVKP